MERQKEKWVEIYPLHTSGHTTPRMLAQVINAVAPQDEIIPMHTEKTKEYKLFPIRAQLKDRIRE